MAESPSGSVHYYFKWIDGVEIKNSASRIGPGIDVRAEGGMVIGPPSAREDGAYRWLNDLAVAEAPAWLIEAAILASARPAPGGNGNVPPHLDGYRSTGAGAELPAKDLAEIELAVKAIPNSDVDWETWNTTGMAIFAATDGKGFAIFDGYSQRSKKYNAAKTAEKWNSYFQSPPTSIGVGVLLGERGRPELARQKPRRSSPTTLRMIRSSAHRSTSGTSSSHRHCRRDCCRRSSSNLPSSRGP